MNTGKKHLFILPFFFTSLFTDVCFAQADTAVKKTGFISVTGAYITYKVESPEKKLLDSLQWQRQGLLVKKYAGKKIKQVLFQKSTGRVMIFLHGRDNVLMDKTTAIQEGLLKPDIVKRPAEKRSYSHVKPIDIYIDSPIYIGIKNKVTIYGPDESDFTINSGIAIKNAGTQNEYIITAATPGTVIFFFIDSITKKTKYVCHARVKRLPADDLAIEPEVRLGNIKTLTTDADFLKLQTEIIVGSGFSVAGGQVYFTGPGFKDVIVAALDKKLTYVKPYLDLCLPGSYISFDNVTVKDPNGKVYAVAGFSIKVIDPSSPADASEDYYMVTDFPQFADRLEDGLKHYVRQQLAADGNDIENKKAGFTFKVKEDGSVAAMSDVELSALTSFESKCFDIIKNGPTWTPGKFKGKIVAMAVTFTVGYD